MFSRISCACGRRSLQHQLHHKVGNGGCGLSRAQTTASEASEAESQRRARARQKRDLIYSLLFLPAVFVTFHDKVVEVRFHKAQPERDEDELGETRLLLVNKFDPIPQLSRGELITIASPNDPGVTLVRRLVALPGDSILTRPTRDASSAPDWIYPFAVRAMPTRNGIVVTVPRGKVWVESPYGWESDSNTFGPVPMAMVRGRVTWNLFPLSKFGPIKPFLSGEAQQRFLSLALVRFPIPDDSMWWPSWWKASDDDM